MWINTVTKSNLTQFPRNDLYVFFVWLIFLILLIWVSKPYKTPFTVFQFTDLFFVKFVQKNKLFNIKRDFYSHHKATLQSCSNWSLFGIIAVKRGKLITNSLLVWKFYDKIWYDWYPRFFHILQDYQYSYSKYLYKYIN